MNLKTAKWTDKKIHLYNEDDVLIGAYPGLKQLESDLRVMSSTVKAKKGAKKLGAWYATFGKYSPNTSPELQIAFDSTTLTPGEPSDVFKEIHKIHGTRTLANELKQLSVPMLESLVKICSQYYYNAELKEDVSPLDDTQFDILESVLRLKHPKSSALTTGYMPETAKVDLPYPMPSLDKIKENTDQWGFEPAYVIMDKLDGVSLLYANMSGSYHLFTRGNGEVGQDVSSLLDYISVPDIPVDYAVRGELVMPKQRFESLKGEFANARNMVSGIVNSKVFPEHVSDVDFVAYEVVNPRWRASEQLLWLDTVGFKVPWFGLSDELSDAMLSDALVDRVGGCEYEIDGLVVSSDRRPYELSSDNPDHAFAFKSNAVFEHKQVVVSSVAWQISRNGKLAPVVEFEPVELDGSNVGRATAFNAQYVLDNGIGKGAEISIVKSGGVIPSIVDIVKAVEVSDDDMPPQEYGEYDFLGVDFVLVDAENSGSRPQVMAKKLHHALHNMLGVERTGEKTTAKLANAGIETIHEITSEQDEALSEITGMREHTVSLMKKDIQQALETAPLENILASFQLVPGLSYRKWGFFLDSQGGLLNQLHAGEIKLEEIAKLDPPEKIGAETWQTIVSCLPEVLNLMEANGIMHRLALDSDDSKPLSGETIVFTGFRHAPTKKRIEALGGRVVESVSSSVNLVVAENLQKSSEKIKKATEKGIGIIGREELNISLDELEKKNANTNVKNGASAGTTDL